MIGEGISEKTSNKTSKRIGKEKLICMIAAVLVCAAAAGTTVCAAAGPRRDGIRSCGVINYDNGTIVIDSADLIILAEGLDEIETSFKIGAAKALAQVGTHIRQDGSISYEEKQEIDPQKVAFVNYILGILRSQSVAFLAGRQASDINGPVYYKYEKNNLLEVTNSDTGMPVHIVPATADNLSVQTAAWVDGQCLAGNGSDNYYFYQKGFIEAYAAKVGASVEYFYDDTGKIESAKLVFP